MSGRSPRGSPLRPRPPRRAPRGGGSAGGSRGGPVPPGKLQLLERFFTPPAPPPDPSSSSPSPSPASCSSSSSSSSSGGGQGRCGAPPRDPRGFGPPPEAFRDPPGARLRRGLSRSHEGLSPGDPPAGTLGDIQGPPRAPPELPGPRRRRGRRGDPPTGIGGGGDSAGTPGDPLGDALGTFGDPPGGARGSRLRRGLSRSHEGLSPGDPPGPPPPRRGPSRPRPVPTTPGEPPRPAEPPRRVSGRGSRGSRGLSRSQEGLGGARAGPPRRWRSLEALGARRGARGGFSRFLDELTRSVLSPAQLRALGWPPRDPPGDPRGDPRTPPASPRGRPGSGGSPGMEEEEEEEEEEEVEEEGGQEPRAAGGAGGARGPPPARAELEALRERMDRLQDDYANSQRLNLLLEERLRGLAQAMALERAALSRHVTEVLQRVLGTPPRDTVAAWGGAEDEDEEGGEGPLLPPPAFRDPPGGAGPLP